MFARIAIHQNHVPTVEFSITTHPRGWHAIPIAMPWTRLHQDSHTGSKDPRRETIIGVDIDPPNEATAIAVTVDSRDQRVVLDMSALSPRNGGKIWLKTCCWNNFKLKKSKQKRICQTSRGPSSREPWQFLLVPRTAGARFCGSCRKPTMAAAICAWSINARRRCAERITVSDHKQSM